MRIRMAGAYTLSELEDAIDRIVQSLKCNGVTRLRAVNLYLTPYRYDTKLEFEDQETGRPFEMMTYAGSRRREFQVISPRLQPNREAPRVAEAVSDLVAPSPRGHIDEFIGLLERPTDGTSPASGPADLSLFR